MLTRWKAGRIGKAGALQAKQFARELEERADTATRARLAAMAATFEALPPGWQEQLENDATPVLGMTSIRHAIRFARDYRYATRPTTPFASRPRPSSCGTVTRISTSDPEGRERMHLVSGRYLRGRAHHQPHDPGGDRPGQCCLCPCWSLDPPNHRRARRT